MRDLNFVEYTVERFNELCMVNISKEMSIEEFNDHLKTNDVDYACASYCKDDAMRAHVELLDGNEHECELVFVNGVYLVLL